MASKGKKVDFSEEPAKVRSTALGTFERTHGRVQHHGRTQPAAPRTRAAPRSHTAAGPSSYLRSNASALRSNARLVSPSRHSGYSRSNAGCAVERE
jgi:hypothetical protein